MDFFSYLLCHFGTVAKNMGYLDHPWFKIKIEILPGKIVAKCDYVDIGHSLKPVLLVIDNEETVQDIFNLVKEQYLKELKPLFSLLRKISETVNLDTSPEIIKEGHWNIESMTAYENRYKYECLSYVENKLFKDWEIFCIQDFISHSMLKVRKRYVKYKATDSFMELVENKNKTR